MWKLTLGYGTRDGFPFCILLWFLVWVQEVLVTRTTHPPKNNETLITTFVFVVQRFELFVFLSLSEWAFCSCILFQCFQNYFRHHIFQLHATIYFVPNHCQVRLGQVRLGGCVQHMHIFQCKFVSPFKTELCAIQRKIK